MFEDITNEERQKIVNAVKDKKAQFIFIPSRDLKDKIAKGGDPMLGQLPEGMPAILLGCPDGKGISLSPNLVIKIVNGTIDKRNSYLLSLGEVIVKGDIISI